MIYFQDLSFMCEFSYIFLLSWRSFENFRVRVKIHKDSCTISPKIITQLYRLPVETIWMKVSIDKCITPPTVKQN